MRSSSAIVGLAAGRALALGVLFVIAAPFLIRSSASRSSAAGQQHNPLTRPLVRLILAAFLIMLASSASAQTDPEASHWGVSVSFVPTWNVPDFNEDLFAEPNIDMKGSEFRVGVVRGRDLGGDWGVSFVHKQINDGSSLDGRFTNCFGPAGCGTSGFRYVYRDVTLTGVEIYKFVPFVTIAQRAQVGMTFAAGVGQFKGTAREEAYDPFVGAGDEPATVSEVPAKELFIVDPVPLGRVEISVAVIVAPGFKVRVGGGFNMPGTQVFTVSASYLIRAQ